MLDWALYKKIAGVALEVGRALDQRRPPYVDMGDGRVVICSSRFNVPHIERDLQDRRVVHKPPGWEVDPKMLGNERETAFPISSCLWKRCRWRRMWCTSTPFYSGWICRALA